MVRRQTLIERHVSKWLWRCLVGHDNRTEDRQVAAKNTRRDPLKPTDTNHTGSRRKRLSEAGVRVSVVESNRSVKGLELECQKCFLSKRPPFSKSKYRRPTYRIWQKRFLPKMSDFRSASLSRVRLYEVSADWCCIDVGTYGGGANRRSSFESWLQ